MSTTIHIDNISYKYRRGAQALDRFSVETKTGGVLGILGPNGSGKTTLLSIVARQRRIQQGRIHAEGRLSTEAIRIGWASSEALLYDSIPFDRFVGKVLGPSLGMSEERAASRGKDLAGRLGLDDYYTGRPKTFSQGTRMKASILLAFFETPDLIILDEPFNGLDVATVDRMRTLLHEETHGRDVAVIIADHQVGVLDEIVSDVAFISEGRLLSSGTARELTASHGSLTDAYRSVFGIYAPPAS